ncbi:MAG: SDR family NAD(P)-dependent oxidoreductase [Deltaproteobacteria bacterium]|nr:SDR family NAD(P)-dependent oxidoreductase [Deltaproteobacteria bacterium]
MDVKSVVAVVTGGASGLGEATARTLVAAGAKVSLLDLNQERGQAVAAELGPSAIFCNTDVTDDGSVRSAIAETLRAFGAINVAVNCAGGGMPAKILGKGGPIDLAAFNKVVQLNLMGTVNVIRLVAEKMRDQAPNEEGERGVIINTASAAAFEGQIGQPAYSASKAGIVGMTLPIAREFADIGIRVVTIAPGLFDTPLLAILPPAVKEALGQSVPFPKRLGRPSEYASLAKHIIENVMFNGTVLRLDGAIRMAAK